MLQACTLIDNGYGVRFLAVDSDAYLKYKGNCSMMMTDDRKLLVGIDLCDDVTQMSCYRDDMQDAVPVGRVVGKEREYECPTVLSWHPGRREWLFGLEALQAAKRDEVSLFSHMLKQAAEGDEICAGDMAIPAGDAFMRFFIKLLSELKEYFPNETIRKLVVSVPHKTQNLTDILTKALGQIGIGADRLVLQLHQQSYVYYALNQKKELWMNDIGLFEFGRDGLFYSQIHIDRRDKPYVVGVERTDLSDSLNWDMLEHDSSFKMDYAFVNLANTQLHRQMVTTIYVTGEGFQGEWANEALMQLCRGRRVFRGNNLFTKGACFAAREFAGLGVMKDFLLLDEEMTYVNISLRVYHDASMNDLEMVRAGVRWMDVDVCVDVIPDEEDKISLTVQNILQHETKVHRLSLEGFGDRPNKMTRFTVRIRFADADHCIVTLKDNGFGEFFPSSNRIWERSLSMM